MYTEHTWVRMALFTLDTIMPSAEGKSRAALTSWTIERSEFSIETIKPYLIFEAQLFIF